MVLGTLSTVAVLFMFGDAVKPEASTPLVDVKVTQRYLLPLCLNGEPVKPGERRWRLPLRTQSLAFTMRNAPHRGTQPHQRTPEANAPSGVAAVSFMPEPGHRYEVEIRAAPGAYTSRVWERGQWRPVVRDRTVDRIVSSEPEWRDAGCQL